METSKYPKMATTMLTCTKTKRMPSPEFKASAATLDRTVDSALSECLTGIRGQASEIAGQISNFDTHVNFLEAEGAYLVSATLTATAIYKTQEQAHGVESSSRQRLSGGGGERNVKAKERQLPDEVQAAIDAVTAEYRANKASRPTKASCSTKGKSKSKSEQIFTVGPVDSKAEPAAKEEEGKAEEVLSGNSNTGEGPSVRGLFDD